MRQRLLSAFLLACAPVALSAPALGQAAPAPAEEAVEKTPFVKVEGETVVRELARQLEENFVFPDAAKAYAAMLRSNLATGKYASFADADAFAAAVTADLQAVHEDGHLKLSAPRKAVDGKGEVRSGPPPGFKVISRSGWVADGVAYIRFEAFPGNEPTLAQLRAFIETHKDAKSLIIDARTHRGGGLAEMDLLFPHLFDEPTTLVMMDTRLAAEERNEEIGIDSSLHVVDGPEGVVRRAHRVVPAAGQGGLAKAKVYLLTSGRTVSAGEHLSLSLKRTGRATLIGETTRGAGHYGGMVDLGHGYAAFIPIGRTFDPDTGEGWEGTGVAPHVAVPADQALDEALRRAGVTVGAEAALAALK